MALVFKDRVKETTTTSGTGTITLAGAVSGFQTFSVIGDGNTTYYTIVSGTDWEVGIGTYTLSGTTLSRDTILESSNGGSAISLSGTSTVFCTYAAEKSVYRNSNDQINVTASGLIFSDSTVQTTAAAVSGDNVGIFVNDAGYLTTHPAISAASDSDNSGRTYIQDLLLDSYGHVTGISTATETVVDTDTTYTAGSGITIDGSDNIHVYGGSGQFIDLKLQTDGVDDLLTLTSTNDGSDAAPVISTMRDSASPADGDYLGQLKFKGRSDTGTERVYAKITGKTLDVTNGTEDGLIEFAVRSAGSQEIISRIRNDGWRIINDNNLYIQDNGSLGVRVDPTYSLHVKDDAYIGSGVTLPDVAPAVTTNKLYNNGGTLYFNGSAVDTDTTYTAGSGLELSGTEFNAKTATTSASGITTLTNTIDATETKALTPKAVNDAGYITGTGNANQVAIFDTTTSVSGAQGIEIETTGDPGLDIFRKSGQTTTLVNIYTESTGILTVIDENGYIGIGTGDPTYHLQVEGTGDFDTIRFSDGSLQTTSASGAVIGPASSTDNAIARFDGATGKLIQDTSGATIDDNNILTVNGLKIGGGNWWGLDSETFSTIPFESGTPAVLTFNGSALNTNYVYTVRLTNRETNDFHGSSYIVYDNSGTWDTIQLSEAGTSTELPLLMESGGSVYVYLKGPTADLSGGSDDVTAHMTSHRVDQPQADGDKLSLLPEFIFSNRKNTGAGVSQARQIFPTQDGQSSGYYFGLGTTNPTEALYVADKAYIQSSYSAVTDSTDGGSLTLDFDAGNVFNVALTGNITSVTFSNADAGQKVLINVKQDSAGGYTITGGDWSATKWTDNTAPTLSTASGTVDTIGIMVPRASTYYGYTVGTGIIDV